MESIPVESWKSPGRVLEESWKSPGRVLEESCPPQNRFQSEVEDVERERSGGSRRKDGKMERREAWRQGGMEAGRQGGSVR